MQSNERPLTPDEIEKAIKRNMITREGSEHIIPTDEERKHNPRATTNGFRGEAKAPPQNEPKK